MSPEGSPVAGKRWPSVNYGSFQRCRAESFLHTTRFRNGWPLTVSLFSFGRTSAFVLTRAGRTNRLRARNALDSTRTETRSRAAARVRPYDLNRRGNDSSIETFTKLLWRSNGTGRRVFSSNRRKPSRRNSGTLPPRGHLSYWTNRFDVVGNTNPVRVAYCHFNRFALRRRYADTSDGRTLCPRWSLTFAAAIFVRTSELFTNAKPCTLTVRGRRLNGDANRITAATAVVSSPIKMCHLWPGTTVLIFIVFAATRRGLFHWYSSRYFKFSEAFSYLVCMTRARYFAFRVFFFELLVSTCLTRQLNRRYFEVLTNRSLFVVTYTSVITVSLQRSSLE